MILAQKFQVGKIRAWKISSRLSVTAAWGRPPWSVHWRNDGDLDLDHHGCACIFHARGLPRVERFYPAFSQQNGTTAMILALLFSIHTYL